MIPSRVVSPSVILLFACALGSLLLLGCSARRPAAEARHEEPPQGQAAPPAVAPAATTPGSVEVSVVDAAGVPQSYVDVSLTGVEASFQRADLTDEHGRFRFVAVPPGKYGVSAYMSGLVSEVYPVELVPGEERSLNVALRPVAGYETVVLDASVAELTDVSSEFQGEFIQKIPLGNRSVQDIIAAMPGVIRTGSTDSTHAEPGQHAHDMMSQLPTTAIQSFRLITDGASAQYGALSTGVAEAGISGGVWPGPHPRSGETYRRTAENRFRSPLDAPLSTFAIDVDTASYSIARSWIEDGELPPPEAVRVEEFINTFLYDDPGPSGGDAFAASTEVASCPWEPAHRLVRIAIKGAEIEPVDMPPSNLVFLVDVSGSMAAENKLPLVQKCLQLLAERLRPEDTVGLVTYAGASRVALEPVSGSERARIAGAIEGLSSGGSTAGAAGIRTAYELAERHFKTGGINRVILATDGDFNVGTSSDSELVRLIEQEREKGVFLTVLGFGQGNYQDAKMEQLADHGNGNYAYVDSLDEGRRVLVAEAAGTLYTIAKDVKIQVEFNPARVARYRLIGYENRLLADEDFDDDTKDGGEIGAGHSVTALYEVVPAGEGEPAGRKSSRLRYQEGPEPSAWARSGELLSVKLRWKLPDGQTSDLLETQVFDDGASFEQATPDLRWSATAAAFAMMLQGSRHVAGMSWADLDTLAATAIGRDEDGRRAQMIALAQEAAQMQRVEVGSLGR